MAAQNHEFDWIDYGDEKENYCDDDQDDGEDEDDDEDDDQDDGEDNNDMDEESSLRMPGSGSPSLGRAHPDNCFLLNLNSSKNNSIISIIKNQQYHQYYQKPTVLSKPIVLSCPRIVCL